MRRVRVSVVVSAFLVVACGATPQSTSVNLSDAEEACIDFYRSVEESTEEETLYMRVFADRIAEAGYDRAAAVLSDVADQWEVGTWEGDEVTQLAQWVEAGALLEAGGELRCADLSEWWGIDGYEGEPAPDEVLNRQAGIWEENGLDDYYLLVAGKTESDERFTQIQVRVTDGQVDEITEVEVASVDPSDLPKTIEDYYEMIFDLGAHPGFFDLVRGYPRRASLPDGTEYQVRLAPGGYPDPLAYFDTPEAPLDEG